MAGTWNPNTVQAYDDGENNIWDDGNSAGNYWNDWNPPIGPYEIDGDAESQDRYPLGQAW